MFSVPNPLWTGTFVKHNKMKWKRKMYKMQAQFLKLLLDSKNIKFYCQVAVEVSKHFLSLYCPDIPMLPTEGASLRCWVKLPGL